MNLAVEKKAFEEEKYPDQKFLGQAIRDGRAMRQDVSMKALGTPSLEFQSRVTPFDLRHCANLQLVLKEGGQLQRVVIFRDNKTGRMLLADGFHRWKASLNEKARSIPAWVIESGNAEFEAMLYSTMCNRENCLPKTRDDHKKGVMLLFANPTTWKWADSRLAVHCGVATGSITRWRLEYATKEGVELPSEVETAIGTSYPYASGRKDKSGPRLGGDKRNGFHACVAGKSISLGTHEERAKAKLASIVDEKNARLNRLNRGAVEAWLNTKGVITSSYGLNVGTHPGLFGLRCGAFTVTWYDPRDNVAFPATVGRALMLAAIDGVGRTTPVVLCWREDCPPELLKLGEACGVSFMTPEEFMEDLLSRKAS